jgi:Protein of unknown function (DUF3102)/DNA N-6-adenine-methyltransferase (Dam)
VVRSVTAPALNLAVRIEAEHQAAIGAARTAIEHAVECGKLLLEAKAQIGHGGWLPWVEANLSFGDRQARKYMRLAQHFDQIGSQNADLTLDQAVALLASPKDASHTLQVMGSSASPEWYTPPRIVERVVETLGEVDLDPSWHPESPVQARVTYTVTDDGLAQRWGGRVYLNPPYGRAIDAWVAKLVEEYEAGTVSEAIALVPARVDTEWFRRLDPFPRCFVYGRLTFANAEHPAPFPSAIVYLGRNVARFIEVFEQVGSIFVRLDGGAAPKTERGAGLCQHLADGNTLVGRSAGSDETLVEITGTGGEYVWLTTLVNTEVVGMRRPVRSDAVEQVLAVIGIEPDSLAWQVVPGEPPLGLREVLDNGVAP